MSWKRHLKTINLTTNNYTVPKTNSDGSSTFASSTSSAIDINKLYSGHPNRMQRYKQFDDMTKDSIIATGLNIIADFCTQTEEQAIGPFEVEFDGLMSDTEMKIITKSLRKWTSVNNFTNRLWDITRGILQKGDQFFIVDPETFVWSWVNPYAVIGCSIDRENFNKITHYHIKAIDLNTKAMLATLPDAKVGPCCGTGGTYSGYSSTGGSDMNHQTAQAFQLSDIATQIGSDGGDVYEVDADYVVHLSTNNGMNNFWPFGTSILESVYQTFRQKQLIEDAVLIYRIQYAPVRRVFNIDVGDMNPTQANAYIERFKNENHQRRTVGKNGSLIDSAYNPLSMLEDYYFASSSDGRGSKVELLQGGDQVGEITDLSYWDKKLRDGLGIPSTYMPGVDNAVQFNDGKLGQAMIQEYIFTKMCTRLQKSFATTFDREFKRYLEKLGLTVDRDGFTIQFCPPQNFQKYRQIEIDTAQTSVYTAVKDFTILSERFKLERFLNLTQEEIQRNERLWAEENPSKIKQSTGEDPIDPSQPGLEDIGMTDDSIATDDSAESDDSMDDGS